MSKRVLDLFSPSPSPSKRARFEPGTSSPPHRYAAAAASDSSPFTHYSFPSSGTGTSTPYSVPSDSPSNPFGLQRALVALKLPRPSGFKRHVPLRFQLVYDPPRRDTKGKGKARADAGPRRSGEEERGEGEGEADATRALARELENVYRVVQVPANYTFRHLHKVILWLFASDARWAAPPGAKLPTRHRRSTRLKELQTPPPPSAHRAASLGAVPGRGGQAAQEGLRPAMGAAVPPGWAGHVFEVRDGVQMYNPKYRPGAIKREAGRVRVRLSSERDRKLFPDLYGDDPFVDQCAYAGGVWGEGEGEGEADVDAVSVPETGFEGDVDDESADDAEGSRAEKEEKQKKEWVWEAEDDYTVGHVWETGTEEDQGVIYHHLPGVSVHITTSFSRLPPRRGIGNQPHVFRWRGSARGAIRIAHLGRPSAPAPSSASSTASSAPKPAAPRVSLSDEVFEDETDPDERRLRRWNALDAFARFLVLEEERERALRRTRTASLPSADIAWSSPPATHASSTHSLRASSTHSPRASSTHSPLPPSSPPRYSSSPTRPGGVAFPLIASPQTSPRRTHTHASKSPRARARTLSYPLSSPGPFPLTTPFPAHPLLARRVRRASRRFERITRSGLEEMESSEEEGRRRGRKRKRRAGDVREGGDAGEGVEAGVVLVADSDGENNAPGEVEFDGDALFAEDVEGDDGAGVALLEEGERGDEDEDDFGDGDGDVGDLQSDDFWRGLGGLDVDYPQWIGEGREEDWDPFCDVEV